MAKKGLGMPTAVDEAIQKYKKEMDSVVLFIEETCVVSREANEVS